VGGVVEAESLELVTAWEVEVATVVAAAEVAAAVAGLKACV